MGDIFIVKSHIVNRGTVLLTGEFALLGKLCTRILEENKTCFLIEKTPLSVLDESIRHIGYNLKGAIESSKLILGGKSMVPIMINPAQGVCLFPIISPIKHNCIWFNPKHIINTTPAGKQTIVHLSIGISLTIDMRISTFNNKLQIARHYCELISGRASNEICSLYPTPVEKKQIIIKEEDGKFDFNILKEDTEEE